MPRASTTARIWLHDDSLRNVVALTLALADNFQCHKTFSSRRDTNRRNRNPNALRLFPSPRSTVDEWPGEWAWAWVRSSLRLFPSSDDNDVDRPREWAWEAALFLLQLLVAHAMIRQKHPHLQPFGILSRFFPGSRRSFRACFNLQSLVQVCCFFVQRCSFSLQLRVRLRWLMCNFSTCTFSAHLLVVFVIHLNGRDRHLSCGKR